MNDVKSFSSSPVGPPSVNINITFVAPGLSPPEGENNLSRASFSALSMRVPHGGHSVLLNFWSISVFSFCLFWYTELLKVLCSSAFPWNVIIPI